MKKEIDLNQYIKKINFDKQYKKLIKKYKNKRIVIYGSGKFFKLINENYDLSKLNIIGICDRSFETNDKETQYLGYNKILIENFRDCDTDVILTGTLEYLGLINHLKKNVMKKRKITIRPLAYMPLGMYLKKLFFDENN